MILNTKIIEKEGQKKFVVMEQQLHDYEDLCLLREEKVTASNLSTRSFDDVLKEMTSL